MEQKAQVEALANPQLLYSDAAELPAWQVAALGKGVNLAILPVSASLQCTSHWKD